MSQVLPPKEACAASSATARRSPTARSTASARTTCSRCTATSSSSGRTTSGRWSTTARAASARTRSSGTTRRCRPARRSRSRIATGSSPSYRESAIGLLRGMPVSTVLSWWRGHPAGWWNPRVQRRLDLRPDRDAGPARGRVRVGLRAQGRGPGRARLLRRRGDLGGRVPRGADLRRRDEGAGRPLLQQQPVGDLDAALRADGRADARGQGDRLRHPRGPRRRRGRARGLRGDARRGGAGASGRRADVHRGGDVRVRRRTRRPTTPRSTSTRAGRGGARERVRRALRAVPRRAWASSPTSRRHDQEGGARADAGGHRRGRGRAAGRSVARLRARVRDPPPSLAHDLAELRRILGG